MRVHVDLELNERFGTELSISSSNSRARTQPHGPRSSQRKVAFIGPTLVRPDRLGVTCRAVNGRRLYPAPRPVICSGLTHSSNCASVTYPSASAAAFNVVPSLCAFFAICAALS